MSGTYTSNKNLNKPEHGGDIGNWGTGALNNNSTIIDSSLGSVTSISLTGLTTYTLSTADCQNATIKFTGNLANQVVTVLMTTGVSGQFAFIDSTTALGASSTISLGWTASGVTSYVLTPGKTQIVNADGVARVWTRSASPSTGGVTSINIASWVTASPVLTAKQLENSVFYIYGTTASVGDNVLIYFPFPTYGLFTFICNWNYAPIVNIYPVTTGGGSGFGNLPNQSVSMVYCVSNAWSKAAAAVAF
tara:strand:- start:313 stop:1056 length:744 start_codon:yes stop_codon:yes gene_type:complete